MGWALVALRARISEIIKALRAPVEGVPTYAEGAGTLRLALEAAQQEAEAWEAIEQWINKRESDGDAPMYEEFPMFFFDGEFNVGFAPHGELYAVHTAKTLLDLAAWCRAELSK